MPMPRTYPPRASAVRPSLDARLGQVARGFMTPLTLAQEAREGGDGDHAQRRGQRCHAHREVDA